MAPLFMRMLLALLLSATPAVALPNEKRQAPACANPVQRRSWTALSNDDKLAYLNAEKCLMNTAPGYGISGAQHVWDELQWVHIRNTNWIHGVAAFLPWHRYYMTVHERLLQRHCGFQGGVPFWDEAVDANNIRASPVWDPTYGVGGDGEGENRCVPNGPFSNLTLRFNGDATPGNGYCLARQFDEAAFRGARQEEVDICFNSPDWAGASGCYENFVHTAGHDGTGRVMADALLAPGDPIFFLHREVFPISYQNSASLVFLTLTDTNLDRLWWRWQQAGLPGRLTEMNRPNTPSAEFNQANGWSTPGPEFTEHSGDGGPETTLNHILWMGGILPNATIRDVMDLRGETICAEYVY